MKRGGFLLGRARVKGIFVGGWIVVGEWLYIGGLWRSGVIVELNCEAGIVSTGKISKGQILCLPIFKTS